MLYSTNGNLYSGFMASLLGQKHLIISVRACRDAQIALMEVPGVTTMATYEVTIGANGNTRTMISESVRGEPVVDVATPAILACDVARVFWVSWRMGMLEVGTGASVGSGRVAVWKHNDSHTVEAASVTTPQDVTAMWVFPEKRRKFLSFEQIFAVHTVRR